MNLKHFVRRYVAALVLAAASLSSHAQNPGTGNYPYARLDSFGFDSINPGNLNTHFVIPIVNKQGRGVPFQYSLDFDSLIWTPTVSGSTTTWAPDPSFGLHGYLLNDGYKGFLSYSNVSHKCFDDPDNPGYWEWLAVLSNYVYHDEFGVSHPINYSYNVCTDVTTGNGGTSDGSGFSFDGSNVRSRSGLTLFVPTYVNGAINTLNATITDSNGNKVTNDLNGTFTDTMGLTPLKITGGGTASSPRVFTFPTTTGTTTVSISYTTKTVNTAFGCTGITEYGPKSVDLPTTITLPDLSTYVFTYENQANGDSTGRIASIKLPSGGTISYLYTGTHDGVNCSDGSTTGLTRSTSISSDGNTAYVRSSITSTGSHTEVTGPHADQTEVDFVNAAGVPYETTRSVYSGSHTGTLLAKTDTCYNTAAPPSCTTQSLTMPISKLSVYRTVGSVENGSDTTYNPYGLVTDIKEYNYGTGSRGTVLRETAYSYAVIGSYLTDRVASIQKYDGAGNEYAATTYGYDSPVATGTTGLPQHVAVSGPRGNLTSQQVWTSSTAHLDTGYSVYDTGQPYFSTDANQGAGGVDYQATTSYGYDPTGTLLISVTPPAPTGVSLAIGYGYDSNTGLLTSVTDPNNPTVPTQLKYDALQHLIETDTPDSGKSTTTYTSTQASAYAYQTLSGVHTDTETLFDALGRQSRVAVSNGQSTNPDYQVDACYNQAALTSFTSYAYQGTGWGTSQVCSGSGDTTTYDPLGRISSVAHGDGTSVTYTYTGRATKITDENTVSRISQVDGLGRTVAVCEISSTSTMPGSNAQDKTPVNCNLDIAGTGFLTTYAYDDAHLKTTVTQGSQTRIFQTDWAGRPILTQEPESGQTTYSYTYNSSGFVVTRSRPKANQLSSSVLTTTTTQYDQLYRLLSKTYSDGTPTKTFAYDSSAGWSDLAQANLKGNLSIASVSNAKTVFSYDQVGRISYLDECLPSGCGTATYNRLQHYVYDLAGNMTSSTDGNSITSSYSVSPANELLSLTSSLTGTGNPTSLISAVKNGPNGPVSYSIGNGLSSVFGYDTVGRISGGWVCNGSTSSSCTGGTMSYGFTNGWKGVRLTGSSDSVLNQGSTYTYDEFNRLTARTVNTGTAQNYAYTYDRYGNRWSQTLTAGTIGPQPSFTFNTANNQITTAGYGYDAAGNMLNDGSHTYTYDAEGNITAVDGGSTATYAYNALNQRVKTAVGTTVTEYVFNSSGKRVSMWNGSTHAQLRGQYYWGGKPVAYYVPSGATHFQHQDWLGTERLRTTYTGAVEGTYASLPFGDGPTTTGTDTDAYHFASLDSDTESATDHAQFRQYNSTQGHWMSPDPFSGSYDSSNPQSLNRYAYAGNNPLSFTDPSGLEECFDADCENPIDGGCDPIFYDCDGGDEPIPYGPPPPPEFKGYENLDPDRILTENLGLPAGMQLPTGGILDIFGLGGNTRCDFGACEPIGDSYQRGEYPNNDPSTAQNDVLGMTLDLFGKALAKVGQAAAESIPPYSAYRALQCDSVREANTPAGQRIIWGAGFPLLKIHPYLSTTIWAYGGYAMEAKKFCGASQ